MPALAETYRARLNLEFTPSAYQANVFDWIESGRGHAVVRAVAGSGKTTTIVLAARLLAGSGMFLAFNKSIATELSERLAGTTMAAATVHSHGFTCVRTQSKRCKVNKYKYTDMVEAAATKAVESGSLRGYKLSQDQIDAIKADGFPVAACEQLINLARLDLLDIDADPRDFHGDLMELADRHGIDFAGALDWVVSIVVRNCLCIGADRTDEIDFTDMIWLPVVNAWRPRQYGWIFVDECQDLSRCALELIRSSLRAGGRILFVGDERQAIYGFAGADAQSFANIVETCEATVLPLSVCYRCPTSALDIARQWVPQIEAREGAPVGEILPMTAADYASEAREGDLVICRRNAPLIGLCFDLIAEGMPATVRGRADVGDGLIKLAHKVGKRWDMFEVKLSAWETRQIEISTKRSRDADRLAVRIEQIHDQAEALRIIAARSNAQSAADLESAIAAMFSDERGAVVLSTIHKAKGLEAERVGILDSHKLPAPARQDWQAQQEENLAYVAWTRAKATVIEING